MKLTIFSIPVTVSDPYQPGHQLTADEAEYINTLRARTVVNNLRRKLLAAKRTGKELQPIVDEYDRRFSISNERVPAAILEECALKEAKRQRPGGTRHELHVIAEELLANPAIQQQARELFQQRKEFAKQALEELQ